MEPTAGDSSLSPRLLPNAILPRFAGQVHIGPVTVTIDGVPTSHVTVLGWNALAQCPNNVCSYTGSNGFLRFHSNTGWGAYSETSSVHVTMFGQTYSYYKDTTLAIALDPFGLEWHHFIPQEFEPFMPPGIDIEDYGMLLPRWLHGLLPFGLHTKAFNWNGQWRTLMNQYNNAPTVEEVKRMTVTMFDRLRQHLTTVTQVIGQAYEEVEPEIEPILQEIPPLL